MTYDGRTRIVIMAEPRPDAIDLVMRDLPALQPGEALVKVRHAGICGTDLHIIGWNAWAARAYKPPFALGHEFCGEIVDIKQGEPLKVGDRVTAETHLACGHCAQCRARRGHTCDNLKTFSRLDRGAFTDYLTLPVKLLRRVPDGVSDRIGAIMEPLGISVRCAREAGSEGKHVLVSGCGPIGLMAIAAAKHLGAASLLAADPAPQRCALALKAGADVAIDPLNEDLVARVQDAIGTGVDVVIETSGAAIAIQTALKATTRGGTMVLVGLPAADVPIDLAGQVVLREVALRGAYGRLLDQTWLDMERALKFGLDIDDIITHSFPLEGFREAISTARSAAAGKVLFDLDRSIAT